MHTDFERLVAEAEQQAFAGWDFRFLSGRLQESSTSWNYRDIVIQQIKHATSLLDMGTGGGEFLAALPSLPPQTYATEGYRPNVPIARGRLEPLGVQVCPVAADDALPFADEHFDLIINRHASFAADEVQRILQRKGYFITQQVGGQNNMQLNQWFEDEVNQEYAEWSLNTAVKQLAETGFTILRQAEEYPEARFFDIGAVVYYLKVIEWQIPGFTVEKERAKLLKMHQIIKSEGNFVVKSHRFLIEARKP